MSDTEVAVNKVLCLRLKIFYAAIRASLRVHTWQLPAEFGGRWWPATVPGDLSVDSGGKNQLTGQNRHVGLVQLLSATLLPHSFVYILWRRSSEHSAAFFLLSQY